MDFLNRLFQKREKIHKVDVSKVYQLHSRMGQGSMSKVWKATDPSTQRLVAVKVMDMEKLAKLNQRFAGTDRPTEGEMALQMDHPNLVKTFVHGITTDNEEFLVMEFIEGQSLTHLVTAQDEHFRKHSLRYAIQLGEALHALHSKNWIHRDLCPRNVMISNQNVVKLIDFGLMVPNTPVFRKPGNRTGTANYMAPELVTRKPTDHRLDIYAYSVMCFEMFTGQLPWPSADSLEAVLQHVNQPPKEILELRPKLDSQIAATVMKGLARDPDERWQTMREMVDEFRSAAKRLSARS